MRQILIFVLIVFVSITSCKIKDKVDQDSEHAHEHEEVKLKIVKYTDQFELFAETDPFSKNRTSEILAHFTNLHDFKPLTDASVNAILKVGDSEVKQTVEKNERPGIYSFSLKPEKSGLGKLIFEINSKTKHAIEVEVVIYGDENTALIIAEKKQVDNINAINFTKEQSWKIDFATVHPIKEYFGKVIKTTAQVLPNQYSETVISAKTNGIVKLTKNILEGQEVNVGETLFTISGKSLANDNTEVRFLEAKNNFEAAQANYERKMALSKNQIVSAKEVESAKLDYENAKAVYDNLKNNFNENGQIVVVPRDGIIKHVVVKNGEYVKAGDPLFSLTSNDKFLIKADVQQKHISLLSTIASFNIKSSINGKVYSQDELNGKLLSYGKSIDENEGYLIPVNFQIDKHKSFLNGSFVDVFIKTLSKAEVVVVPNSSLVEENGNYFVLVQLTPELFEKREVKTGLSDGLITEIISGINPNERIVSKGALIVKLAAVSNSLDPHAGHVH